MNDSRALRTPSAGHAPSNPAVPRTPCPVPRGPGGTTRRLSAPPGTRASGGVGRNAMAAHARETTRDSLTPVIHPPPVPNRTVNTKSSALAAGRRLQDAGTEAFEPRFEGSRIKAANDGPRAGAEHRVGVTLTARW